MIFLTYSSTVSETCTESPHTRTLFPDYRLFLVFGAVVILQRPVRTEFKFKVFVAEHPVVAGAASDTRVLVAQEELVGVAGWGLFLVFRLALFDVHCLSRI